MNIEKAGAFKRRHLLVILEISNALASILSRTTLTR
jgi:hypothetical protein